MKQQDYAHHVKYDALYHFLTAPLALSGLITSTVLCLRSSADSWLFSALLMMLFLLVCLLVAIVRLYSLKVQDRVIRAEENLRHFMLTGKPLDSRLQLGQIIALRFASDEEMPELAKQAVERQLSASQIKQAIRNWKADHLRV